MNRRIINVCLVVSIFISALPIQGMSFVRRMGGSVAAAARMVTARVGCIAPRVAQAPVRSLSKISGRSAMNPVVSQAVRRASTHAEFDVKKLSRAQKVGVAIGIVGIIGFDAYEKFSKDWRKDWRDIFKKGESEELQRWFREHDCDEKLQKKIINYCMTHWDTLSADKLHVVIDNVPEAAAAFTQSAVDNFAKLAYWRNGRDLVHKIMEKNPAAVQAFTQSAADNFVKLVDWPDSIDLLHEIMEKNPAAVQAFTQSAADNIAKLVDRDNGCKLLHEIMEKNPAAVQAFTQSAADNFAKLVGRYNGRDLLHEIMKNDSAAAQAFTQSAADNIVKLVGSPDGKDLVHKIMEKNPAAVQALTQSAADNFAKLVDRYNGCELLHEIMEKNPAAAQAFTQSAADNIAALVKSWYGSDFLHEIMEKNSAAVQTFTQSAADNMVELVKSYFGKRLLNNLMKKNPATVQIFTQSAAENIVELIKNEDGRNFLHEIIENNSGAMELFSQATEKAGIEIDFNLLLQIQKKHARGEQLSPSEAHLLANKHLVLDKLLPQDVQELQHTVLMKEHQLLDAGYVPFYHAQSNEKWFPIELDTFLHGIQSGEQVDEFYLMHTQADLLRKKARDVASESGAMHEAIMHDSLKAKDALERERLVHASKGGGDDRKRMLFLNGSLRGNASNWGSQSFPGYFMLNWNAGGKYHQLGDTMRNVFKDRGLDCMYEQFKDELQQLHEEYIKLSKYGTLYQIAIPRDKAGQVVRPAVSGGGKVNLRTSKGYLWDRHTDNMHEIIAASSNPDTHPGDQNEFVAMMTYDENGLMNPKCGAKIKAYMIPTDEAKYQEWCAKWEDLKARIKAEVERTRPADYVAPAHVQELVGLYADAYARSSKPHLYGSRGWLKWLFG